MKFVPDSSLVKNGDFEMPLKSIYTEKSLEFNDANTELIYDFNSPSGYAYIDVTKRKSSSRLKINNISQII